MNTYLRYKRFYCTNIIHLEFTSFNSILTMNIVQKSEFFDATKT